MLAVHLPDVAFLMLFLPAFASGLYGFYCIDSLLRYQHQYHFEDWVKDGRPIGFFWIPPDAALFRGSLARNYASFSLLICRKPWIDSNADMRKLRRRCQLATLVYFAAFALVAWLIFQQP